MPINDATIAHDLAHVYWIGGSPCSGKSSIADELVERYGFALYRCDEAFYRHAKIVTPEQQPTFHRLINLSSEDLWMRPVEQQIQEEITHYREEFPLILEDLLSLPRTQPILAERAALLPENVQPLLLHGQQALWIVPTSDFQTHHYGRREWAKDIVKECTNPEQAFLNWMQRDIGFAQKVRHAATQLALPVLIVNGQRSLQQNRELVEQQFGLHPSQISQ